MASKVLTSNYFRGDSHCNPGGNSNLPLAGYSNPDIYQWSIGRRRSACSQHRPVIINWLGETKKPGAVSSSGLCEQGGGWIQPRTSPRSHKILQPHGIQQGVGEWIGVHQHRRQIGDYPKSCVNRLDLGGTTTAAVFFWARVARLFHEG